MKVALWHLVAAFQVALQMAAQIPVQPHFDLTKFSGKWYALGLVKNDRYWKLKLTHEINWVKQANGDVHVLKLFPPEKNCKNFKVVLKATGQPGKFQTTSKSKFVYRMMETDYDNYGIVHVHGQRTELVWESYQTINSYALFLYSRKPEASDDVKEKFKLVAKAVDLSSYKITYISDSGPCPKP